MRIHLNPRGSLTVGVLLLLVAGCRRTYTRAPAGKLPPPIVTTPFDGSALTDRVVNAPVSPEREPPIRLVHDGVPLRVVLYIGSRVSESASDWEATERETIELGGRYALRDDTASLHERTVRRTELALRPSTGDEASVAARARTETLVSERLSRAGAHVLDKAYLLRLQSVVDSSATRQQVEMAALARHADILVEAIHHTRRDDAAGDVVRLRAIRVADGQVLATTSSGDTDVVEPRVHTKAVAGVGYVTVTSHDGADERVRRAVDRIVPAVMARY